MPNHVINEVIFPGLGATTELFQWVKNGLLDAKGKVSFAVLLPPPLNYWRHGVGSQHDAMPGNCLDWNSKNWSTKWDAYGDPTAEVIGEDFVLRFKTAWSPPLGWYVAIFNYFGLSFDYCYLSEGDDESHAGRFDIEKTERLFDKPWHEWPIADVATHRRLHKMLWGVEEFPPEGVEEAK